MPSVYWSPTILPGVGERDVEHGGAVLAVPVGFLPRAKRWSDVIEKRYLALV